MNEPIKMYCAQCDEEHIVSPTVDSTGNVVGYFCNREKLMAVVYTSKWNGVDVVPLVREYIAEKVDFKALLRMKPDRVPALAKRIAYQLMQEPKAKELRLSYAVMQWHFMLEIGQIHSKLTGIKIDDPQFYARGEE